jgi:hypothetical protein
MLKAAPKPGARHATASATQVLSAFERLFRAKALQMLIRGALPLAVIRRLLQPALGSLPSLRLPEEAWASVAAKFALDTPLVGLHLAEALGDRLGWDREPARAEDWQRLAEERPLEALWVGALSEDKAIRKGYPKLAASAVRAFTASPECPKPSWEFVDILLDQQALAGREVDRLLKAKDELHRRTETERERSEDLRDELKRLRRENAELRAERAAADKRAAAATEARARLTLTPEGARLEETERRLRKAEKEAEHLRRELDRRDALAAPEPDEPPSVPEPEVARSETPGLSIADDTNPRRRVLRQMLKKLFKKGKIGASHTHEDNVYRGVADHDKGLAKEAMDLLYREGLLMPKPTTTDPHVSLRPDRTAEVRAIVAGEIKNPRLARFVEETP